MRQWRAYTFLKVKDKGFDDVLTDSATAGRPRMGYPRTQHGCAQPPEEGSVGALAHQRPNRPHHAPGGRVYRQPQPQRVQRICRLPPHTIRNTKRAGAQAGP